jgi:hypothetical protein
MQLPNLQLDATLPPINLQTVLDKVYRLHATRALYSGWGILTLGFLWRLVVQLRLLIVGERRADFLTPVLHLGGFCLLLSVYRPLAHGCVELVSSLGRDLAGSSQLHDTFAQRMQAWEMYRLAHPNGGDLGLINLDGLSIWLLEMLTFLLFVAVQALAFVLHSVQLFALAAILAYGPLCLGFASLGGIFTFLGTGWFWALVELSAWSFTMDILLFTFDAYGRTIPTQFILVQEMVGCALILAMLTAVPPLTAMLIRGHSASLLQRRSYVPAQSAHGVSHA